ncbi:MAG: hypothetical protein JSS94_01710 [Bacteroidetes bacterium]|nr:hypothetical protein [Bacteroidota bacterium]
MKNSSLLKYFIAFFLPAVYSAQSTSSAMVSIHLGDFHQMALPKLNDQMVFLDFNSTKDFNGKEGEGTPVLLSSTGIFNLFARTANQEFSTVNAHLTDAPTLLALQVNGDEVLGQGLVQIGNRFSSGFNEVKDGQVSKEYTRALQSQELIVASQPLIGYGRPMMGKALKLKYVVSSAKAYQFFQDTDPESANKAVIYTITSN